MLIPFSDLKVGDEVIIATGKLRYVKVLSLPKKPNSKTCRCSVYRASHPLGGGTYEKFNPNTEEHNDRASINFMWLDSIWLVKRENYD